LKPVKKLILVALIGILLPMHLWAENPAAGDTSLKVQPNSDSRMAQGAMADASDAAIATTPLGKVRGQLCGEVVAWRGIPYAQPPTGRLRFKAPVPVQPWAGILDAKSFGPAAPQPPLSSSRFTGEGAKQSENCLTLNIWARAGVKNRPVMVWYHGGAYMSGESSLSMYDGKELAQSGTVVVVTLNYRLGALGCMHFADLAKEAGISEDFTDNPALRDQLAALEWIHGNISAFGGDPGNVTIFGESAGGSSVIALLCTPGARGLFHRAIAQSPAPSSIYGRETGTFYAKKLLELLGLKPDEIGRLRDLPVDQLVSATKKLMDWNAINRPGSVPYGPTYGTDALPLDPLSAANSGSTAGVPLILGTNRDEATLFEDGDPPILPVTPFLINRMLDITNAEKKSRILSAYADFPSHSSAIEAATDAIFRQPTSQFADAYSQHAPTFTYLFDYVAPLSCLLRMGATHGSEIVHVFHTYSSRAGRLLSLFASSGKKRMIGEAMQSSWISFALNGDPNPAGSEGEFWPAFDTKHRATRIFGQTMMTLSDPEQKRREAWQGVTLYR
jgi:para-nitrobenzyl esterase